MYVRNDSWLAEHIFYKGIATEQRLCHLVSLMKTRLKEKSWSFLEVGIFFNAKFLPIRTSLSGGPVTVCSVLTWNIGSMLINDDDVLCNHSISLSAKWKGKKITLPHSLPKARNLPLSPITWTASLISSASMPRLRAWLENILASLND